MANATIRRLKVLLSSDIQQTPDSTFGRALAFNIDRDGRAFVWFETFPGDPGRSRVFCVISDEGQLPMPHLRYITSAIDGDTDPVGYHLFQAL